MNKLKKCIQIFIYFYFEYKFLIRSNLILLIGKSIESISIQSLIHCIYHIVTFIFIFIKIKNKYRV